ncbi:MAG: hypothetical protein KF784_15010 [Fimbriimonadaceae bacterium]|nr:hypothetical protein [Fimbriimonadaceae bacterium]
MSDDFQKVLKQILKYEGGYVNDPVDPGGATNMGIIQKVYDSYRVSKGLAKQPVKVITKDEVADIYEERYWKTSRAVYLKWPLSLAVFDTAVNFGVGRSNQFVAQALGLTGTTAWNPKASELIHTADPKTVALKIVDLRIAYRHARVAKAPSQKKFLKGWLNRDNDLKKQIEA